MCPPPGTLSKYELELLSRRGRESRIFWAVAACIAFNVYEAMRNMKVRGIGLVGAGAQAVGAEAARLLGCTEFLIPIGQRRSWGARRNWIGVQPPQLAGTLGAAGSNQVPGCCSMDGRRPSTKLLDANA